MKFFKKLGPHYAIERFGITFLSLAIAMILLLVTIGINKIKYDTQSLSGMAVYTNSFSMSKTGTAGSVRGVYSNKDHTKVFLLLKYESMDDLPLDANKYELFLTGSDKNMNQSSLKSKPHAMFYLFGSTGYAGVYLYSVEPFPSQIMDLVIRANANFSTGSGSDETTTDSSDTSFTKYNQCRIYFNPGGSYATQVEFLDTDDWTVFDAYEEMVSRPTELVVRATLRNDIKEMLAQRLVITEYMSRVKDDGLLEPEMPVEIANDKFYAISPDDESEEHLSYSVNDDAWYSKDNVKYNTDDVHLYLTTNYVVPSGYDFEWQLCSVHDGYLKSLTKSDNISDWDKYFNDHIRELETAKETFNVDDVEFKYADGSLFDGNMTGDSASSENTKVKRISNDISILKNAWSSYYDIKSQYQTSDLLNLLHIESDARDVQNTYTVNTNDDGNLLIIY